MAAMLPVCAMAEGDSSKAATTGVPAPESEGADCLGCRATGTAAFAFVAAYLLYERQALPRAHTARPFMGVMAAGTSARGMRAGHEQGAGRERAGRGQGVVRARTVSGPSGRSGAAPVPTWAPFLRRRDGKGRRKGRDDDDEGDDEEDEEGEEAGKGAQEEDEGRGQS